MLPTPVTVAHALAHVQALGLDRLDAQMLLLHVFGHAPPAAVATLQSVAARRAAGEPLAYLTGNKEFFGLQLTVDPRVLVPRPDTETLVEWALEVLPIDAPARVVDLGTGSGAIALALKATRPMLAVLASGARNI